jgi:hypothetical protein
VKYLFESIINFAVPAIHRTAGSLLLSDSLGAALLFFLIF